MLRVAGVLALTLLFACSRPGFERQRLPDGTFELRCRHALTPCLDRVADLCKGGSYEVLHASDERRFYGTSDSQVEEHRSRARVRCLKPGQRPREPGPVVEAPPSARPPAPAPALAPAPPAAPARRACVPGSTQACVGPAACSGGQACLADGSGFGPCDCGGVP